MKEKISPALTYLVEYLDLPEATGMPDATWEAFQIRHLNNQNLLAITDKSRQVGWSWLAAAEAVAVGAVQKRATSIFVSINLDEASEKIRYAKSVIEALDKAARPKLLIDNRLELEFDNGSRIISHPCRPVRGKARARVYLDEFAHYANDRMIYQSVVPVISKGGVIRIGSSPLGASGLFWDIYTQTTQRFPGYKRDRIPWWMVRAMCRNAAEAFKLAPYMTTDERVNQFGTRRLKQIYENMILEDFQQEYECEWVDESVAFISWDLLKRNQLAAQSGDLLYRRANGVEAALGVIEDLARLVQEGKIESVLAVGMDIGRKHDTTEIIILGKSTSNQIPYRCGITLDRVEFDDQAAVVNRILERLPVSAYMIDQNGIGMNLAENAVRRWGPKIIPAEFTLPNKELWATEVKLRLQRGEAPIPADRDLVYQIHSIKKKVTSAKNAVYDCDANEKHHADQFWAYALATWAVKSNTDAEDWINAMRNKGVKNEQGLPTARRR